ncbi:SCO6745 family protein [Amycolatopsis cihanbeyliensis]|uniref:Uncharacterized protein n=1 Tax=Amycolatopsis cihanbeyliensis TaxID=1128664 RepID=A0A542DK08_AMYCI|nr:hypothetical protein [Amycolatopsis cihanbeyliensis]TQJ03429.1 hypothetical protein FB471_3189 [Amycolatopsis cihanbeyliensis]
MQDDTVVAVDAAAGVRPFVQRWGGKFMTSTELAQVEQELGLAPRALYFRGRSAVLGDPPPQMVAELFGIFPRWLLDALLPAATSALDSPSAVEGFQEGAARWARARLSDLAEPERLGGLLARLTEAADPGGLALFGGWRRAAWPEGALERVVHGLHLLREYRGGLHFAALRAVGLPIEEAIVADPEGGRGRLLRTGWQPEPADELIARANARPDLHERWRRAETLTGERMGELLVDTLGEPERAELLDRLRALDELATRAE